MSFESIIGQGSKKKNNKNLNYLFQNESYALFLSDPWETPDHLLPEVQCFSGLSRNKRKKDPEWYKRKDLTRKRMAEAQKKLQERLTTHTLLDMDSMMGSVMEDLAGSVIPADQTHFDVSKPYDYSAAREAALNMMTKQRQAGTLVEQPPTEGQSGTSTVEPIKVDLGYVIEENDPSEGVEYTVEGDEIVQEPQSAPVLGMPKDFQPPIERPKSAGKGQNPHKPRVKPDMWRKKKTQSSWADEVEKADRKVVSKEARQEKRDHIKDLIREAFEETGVLLTPEFEENLIYLEHTQGPLEKIHIIMYIMGVNKERQISLTKRHEGIVANLAKTASTLTKQMSEFKTGLEEQAEVTRKLCEMSYGSEVGSNSSTTPVHKIPAEVKQKGAEVEGETIVYGQQVAYSAPKKPEKKEIVLGGMSGIKKDTVVPASPTSTEKDIEEAETLQSVILATLQHMGIADVLIDNLMVATAGKLFGMTVCQHILNTEDNAAIGKYRKALYDIYFAAKLNAGLKK